jgi:predicted DNA-binding transcriptional regulator YafY
MKIDRLLSITLMLINRTLVTARELSEKYEVTVRTIYRDIDAISAAGIPVVAYQGKKGGFCLMENYRIDRQILSLNDMTSILMALKGLNSTFNNKNVDETIEKIESLVPDDKKNIVQQQFENVIIDLSPWGESPEHKKKIQQINKAVSEKKLITFGYRNLQGEESVRCIEPMTLILKVYCWYVHGYCTSKNDFRLFRVSRMRNCEIQNKDFIRKSKVYGELDYFELGKRKEIPITLRFGPGARNRVEEFFGDSIKSVQDDGSCIVKVTFPEDEWVYSTFLSYGDDLEVISPPHLRAIIKEKVSKMIKLYKT